VKDSQLLHDILEAIEAIEKYTVATFYNFVSDPKTQDAILQDDLADLKSKVEKILVEL
jgi:uncharacterized protein with HEPN domain